MRLVWMCCMPAAVVAEHIHEAEIVIVVVRSYSPALVWPDAHEFYWLAAHPNTYVFPVANVFVAGNTST